MGLIALSFARFFARTPWTTLTALFGAALGVASTVAVHLISLSVVDSLDANRAFHLRGLTHLASKPDATMEDYFELRWRWRRGELPGVRALVPILDGRIVENGHRFHIIGIDWLAAYGLPGEPGVAVSRPGAIVADSSLALAIGDRLRLAGVDWPVVGVIDAGLPGGLFADIGDALALLDAAPNRLGQVGVAMRDPWQQVRVWLESLLPGLSAGLPQGAWTPRRLLDSCQPPLAAQGTSGGLYAPGGCPPDSCRSPLVATEAADRACAPAGWELRPVSHEQPGANLANSILFNLGALGTLALVVAWFLIYQVCVLWLRRQAPVIERLGILGASEGELAACFISAVALLGALATFVGLGAGLLLADLLTELSTAGLNELPPPQMSAAAVVKALVSGLGIALVGGWMALRRERVPPKVESAMSRRRLAWYVIALILIGVGIGVPATGLVGGFVAILAAALLAVALLPPFLRTCRRPPKAAPEGSPHPVKNSASHVTEADCGHPGVGGLLTRLAVREATWHERDVGTALGAMVLAVATSVGVGLMVASFKIDFERMLAQRLVHEYHVEMAGGDARALARAIVRRWPAAQAQTYGALRTRIEGRVVVIGHADYSASETARYGHGLALGPDEGLASESLLLALDIDVGDVVEVAGSPIRITATFADFGGVLPRLLLPNETTARLFGPLHFTGIGISGVRGAELESWLAENVPDARVRQRERARARALTIFDRSFAITNALTLLALTVAVAGLYNAMTGLRLNRLATRQLLTALGVSDAEDRLIELIRALGLGACAMVPALPLGLSMGWILCEVINPRAFGWSVEMSLPLAAVAWPMALGFLAAVVAAVVPSPRERYELN